jgi:hypothetical protein
VLPSWLASAFLVWRRLVPWGCGSVDSIVSLCYRNHMCSGAGWIMLNSWEGRGVASNNIIETVSISQVLQQSSGYSAVKRTR